MWEVVGGRQRGEEELKGEYGGGEGGEEDEGSLFIKMTQWSICTIKKC